MKVSLTVNTAAYWKRSGRLLFCCQSFLSFYPSTGAAIFQKPSEVNSKGTNAVMDWADESIVFIYWLILYLKMSDEEGRYMNNNMDLGYEMFCYQCEQTGNGKGCTKLGVCGKTPEITNLQDLLIFQIKGISCYGKFLVENGKKIDKEVISFIENVLFTTLTNVNFDAEVHVELLRKSQEIKENLRSRAGKIKNHTDHASYNLLETKTEMLKDASLAGIMYNKSLDPDIRFLRQTILYGLKGISAYGHQVRELGYYSDQVDDFYI